MRRGKNCDKMLRMNQDLKTKTLALLNQFGQVILSGPPGTGKTRLALHAASASILGDANAEVLPIEKDSQFALVQFHPSYNYEDFVRGIRVTTDDNNNVVYETVNRVFGDMAKRAAQKPQEKHVLVIDEINRANVSAVLGELIYGLEYRGKEVQTPYKVDGKTGLVIPENLQIIGTMNTADRTIGQIDYAVRRRFAFVHCPPDKSVVESEGGVRASEFFKMVDNVFAHLSADYDKEDVCIGHSYFLADGVELANKIIYQVVSILREYLKDGVLKKDAKAEIDAIEEEAKELGKSERVDEEPPIVTTKNLSKWRWIRAGSPVKISDPMDYGPMVLSLVRDYAASQQIQTLKQLQSAFPHKGEEGPFAQFSCFVESISHKKVQKNLSDVESKKDNKRFFLNDEQRIILGDGTIAVVTRQLGAGFPDYFNNFKRQARKLGYNIYGVSDSAVYSPYWYVNTGEREARPHRVWGNCRHYKFIAGGQDNDPDLPHSTASQLKKIPLGAIVFAYRSSFGYLGCGVVTQEATPIMGFFVDNVTNTLGETINVARVRDGFIPEKEFAIGVDWLSDKSSQPGILKRDAYPKTASPIINNERLHKLKRAFGVVDENHDAD